MELHCAAAPCKGKEGAVMTVEWQVFSSSPMITRTPSSLQSTGLLMQNWKDNPKLCNHLLSFEILRIPHNKALCTYQLDSIWLHNHILERYAQHILLLNHHPITSPSTTEGYYNTISSKCLQPLIWVSTLSTSMGFFIPEKY